MAGNETYFECGTSDSAPYKYRLIINVVLALSVSRKPSELEIYGYY